MTAFLFIREGYHTLLARTAFAHQKNKGEADNYEKEKD